MAGTDYTEIADAQVDADSPLDETLMMDGIRDSLTQLRSIVGLGGSAFDVFAGDGSDGAGPTTGAALSVGTAGKEYTDWDVGIEAFTFTAADSQTYFKFGCTGRLTIESGGSLTFTGLGRDGGAGGAAGGVPTVGAVGGSNPHTNLSDGSGGGGGSAGAVTSGSSLAGGAGGTTLALTASSGGAGVAADSNGNAGSAGTAARTTSVLAWVHERCMVGAPGGGGGSSNCDAGSATEPGGAGGKGGPFVIFEVEELDFQAGASIVVSGAAGTAGDNSAGGSGAGGGGGGCGGTLVIIARTVIANAGTITAAGGAGGAGGTGLTWDGGAGGAGGAGRSIVVDIPG